MNIKWEKTGRRVTAEGPTVTYEARGFGMTIESRKRHIPHASRPGTWDYTSYWLLIPAIGFEKEFRSLTSAKEFALGKIKEAEHGETK